MSTKKIIIIGIFIAVVAGVILDTVLKLPILGSIIGSISAVGTFLFSDHSFSLNGWLWLIIGILTFAGLFTVMKIIYDKNSRDKYREKEDVISGLKFRWKESKDSIYNLQCFCPRCDYELTRDRSPYVVTFDSWALPSCPRCGF